MPENPQIRVTVEGPLGQHVLIVRASRDPDGSIYFERAIADPERPSSDDWVRVCANEREFIIRAARARAEQIASSPFPDAVSELAELVVLLAQTTMHMCGTSSGRPVPIDGLCNFCKSQPVLVDEWSGGGFVDRRYTCMNCRRTWWEDQLGRPEADERSTRSP